VVTGQAMTAMAAGQRTGGAVLCSCRRLPALPLPPMLLLLLLQSSPRPCAGLKCFAGRGRSLPAFLSEAPHAKVFDAELSTPGGSWGPMAAAAAAGGGGGGGGRSPAWSQGWLDSFLAAHPELRKVDPATGLPLFPAQYAVGPDTTGDDLGDGVGDVAAGQPPEQALLTELIVTDTGLAPGAVRVLSYVQRVSWQLRLPGPYTDYSGGAQTAAVVAATKARVLALMAPRNTSAAAARARAAFLGGGGGGGGARVTLELAPSGLVRRAIQGGAVLHETLANLTLEWAEPSASLPPWPYAEGSPPPPRPPMQPHSTLWARTMSAMGRSGAGSPASSGSSHPVDWPLLGALRSGGLLLPPTPGSGGQQPGYSYPDGIQGARVAELLPTLRRSSFSTSASYAVRTMQPCGRRAAAAARFRRYDIDRDGLLRPGPELSAMLYEAEGAPWGSLAGSATSAIAAGASGGGGGSLLLPAGALAGLMAGADVLSPSPPGGGGGGGGGADGGLSEAELHAADRRRDGWLAAHFHRHESGGGGPDWEALEALVPRNISAGVDVAAGCAASARERAGRSGLGSGAAALARARAECLLTAAAWGLPRHVPLVAPRCVRKASANLFGQTTLEYLCAPQVGERARAAGPSEAAQGCPEAAQLLAQVDHLSIDGVVWCGPLTPERPAGPPACLGRSCAGRTPIRRARAVSPCAISAMIMPVRSTPRAYRPTAWRWATART
jgi:hypothetical protein